jgi:AraC-like DNA-binding protein
MSLTGPNTIRKSRKPVDPALEEARQRFAQKLEQHTAKVGENATAIAGLLLFRRTSPTPGYCGAYEPSFNLFAQGRKRVKLGGNTYDCDGFSYLISSVDVPVESRIVEASEDVPMLSLLLKLDMPVVREILMHEELPDLDNTPNHSGLVRGETSLELFEVCSRLIDLLNRPQDIPFISGLIQREIIYRLLRSPQGRLLRSIATSGDLSNRTARAISWLKENYNKPLHVDELANVARMGVSTLHHQFRTLTSMSPLQYQKTLRLHAARKRMLLGGLDATTAAYDVGYESVSQFNREYSRLFGQPPMRDVTALRNNKVVAIDGP